MHLTDLSRFPITVKGYGKNGELIPFFVISSDKKCISPYFWKNSFETTDLWAKRLRRLRRFSPSRPDKKIKFLVHDKDKNRMPCDIEIEVIFFSTKKKGAKTLPRKQLLNKKKKVEKSDLFSSGLYSINPPNIMPE